MGRNRVSFDENRNRRNWIRDMKHQMINQGNRIFLPAHPTSDTEVRLTFSSLHLWPTKLIISCPSWKQDNEQVDLPGPLLTPGFLPLFHQPSITQPESTKNRGPYVILPLKPQTPRDEKARSHRGSLIPGALSFRVSTKPRHWLWLSQLVNPAPSLSPPCRYGTECAALIILATKQTAKVPCMRTAT